MTTNKPSEVVKLRDRAHGTNRYIGISAPKHAYGDDPYRPARTTIKIYKEVNGVERTFVGVAEWSECAPPPGRDDTWDAYPKRSMADEAEIDAFLKAFGRDELEDEEGDEAEREMAAEVIREKLADAKLPADQVVCCYCCGHFPARRFLRHLWESHGETEYDTPPTRWQRFRWWATRKAQVTS